VGEKDISGCHGKLLRIDLTKQTHQTENISRNDLRLFLGAAMMLRELPARVGPLSQDNILIFSTGPRWDSPFQAVIDMCSIPNRL